MEQPPGTQLAQLNVATAIDDLDSVRLRDFMGAIDGVNRLAERSPGFVWRLKDEGGNATGIQASLDPRFIINLSVWETPDDLGRFVWQTVHAKVYAKKAKWFAPSTEQHLVMWWVPAGHEPSLEEALARLDELNSNGPTERAFGWAELPSTVDWLEKRCA